MENNEYKYKFYQNEKYYRNKITVENISHGIVN